MEGVAFSLYRDCTRCSDGFGYDIEAADREIGGGFSLPRLDRHLRRRPLNIPLHRSIEGET